MPGKTTVEQALEALGDDPLTYNITLKQGEVDWLWLKGTGLGRAFYNQAQLITSISPGGSSVFQLQDITQAYGEPDYVLSSICYPYPNTKCHTFYLSFYWLSHGFSLSGGGKIKPNVTSDMPLEGLIFFVPNDKKAAANATGSGDEVNLMVPWQGFKDYDFYCRQYDASPCT
jgi:hypothetical protein